ncbi:MAG: hypothetical protein ACK4K7_03800 [Allosphingosinicella sp.]|uniref:hypothetical protein n=1 Tax=Allosphingosinicella sp. TaxID=2823234 RepID=UPI00394C0D0B
MPRDSELPEGTDQIIGGAAGSSGRATTGAGGTAAGTGGTTTGTSGTTTGTGGSTTGLGGSTTGGGGTSSGGGGATGGSGGSSSGFVASSSGGDDTGGTANGVADKLVSQVRDQVQSLRSQATDKIRDYSEQGKDRACGTLDEVSEVIEEAARQIDERLGSEYGDYAHRAASAVHDFADTIRNKSLDDLLDNTRSVVRKSPGMAVATAAVLGFALVRLVKTGLDDVSGRSGGAGGNGTGGNGGRNRSGGGA